MEEMGTLSIKVQISAQGQAVFEVCFLKVLGNGGFVCCWLTLNFNGPFDVLGFLFEYFPNSSLSFLQLCLVYDVTFFRFPNFSDVYVPLFGS